MSAGSSVLFDLPGPKARARYRTFSIAGIAVGVAILLGFLWLMYDNGQLAYDQWEPFVTPRFMIALAKGTWATIYSAVIAILLAGLMGVSLGLGKLSDHVWIRWPSWVIVEFFRAVPVLVLIIFIFVTYGLGAGGIGAFWSLVAGLALYNGAVIAEILRAGVEAVPRGQSEAAYAMGMRKGLVMRQVLLPQAVTTMLPALISQFVVALKDTSLGYVITAASVTYTGRQIFNQFSNQLPTAIVLAIIYILLNIVLAKLLTAAQQRFVGKRQDADAQAEGEKEEQVANAGA